MNKDSKIYVAGHTGFVGSALVKRLREDGYNNLILKTHNQLDLRHSEKVEMFFAVNKPEYVFMCAGLVGGIKFNTENMTDCLQDNMLMLFNIIKYSHKSNVKKLMIFGSNCMYPKESEQPIKEESMLSGYLEPTNEGFALAKVSAIKLVEYYSEKYGSNFISVIPCNLYGIGDHFDLQNSHLISALIQKFHNAKVNNIDLIELWGTGEPLREFLYIDDCVDACMFLMNNFNSPLRINIGYGVDMTIKEIAKTISNIVGYSGKFYFNTDYPDGMKRKLLDSSKLNDFGWYPKITFEEGLKKTYEWFLQEKVK